MCIRDSHLFVIALSESFAIVPAGAAFIPRAWAQIGLGAASGMLRTALILACPVWASALIVDFALGVIARTCLLYTSRIGPRMAAKIVAHA